MLNLAEGARYAVLFRALKRTSNALELLLTGLSIHSNLLRLIRDEGKGWVCVCKGGGGGSNSLFIKHKCR